MLCWVVLNNETLATKTFKIHDCVEKGLLSRPSLNISSNRGAPLYATRSALQSALNDRGFPDDRFLEGVLIPQPPPPVLRSKRPISGMPTT